MDKARRIYERRIGRIVGAGASIGGVALTGAIAAARHRYAIDLSYGTVTLLFGLSMAVGPVTAQLGRLFARRHLTRRIRTSVDQHPTVPAPIMERFVATKSAQAVEEASVSWPLAHRAVMGAVAWLWALGFFSASGLDIVGKAFGFAMANGALSITALAAGLYFGGQRIVGLRARPSLAKLVALSGVLGVAFAAGLERILRADQQALAALVYFAVGGIAVLLPSVWKAKQRLRIERASLAAQTLLAPSSDVESENERLVSTIGWVDGPPEIRAEALRSLVFRIPAAERGPHLDRALDTTNGPLRRAALELCHKLRHTPSLERLLALAHEPSLPAGDARLLPALLHRRRAPEVQDALLNLLRHGSIEVRETAALSLGLVGEAASVVHLREAGRVGGRMSEVCNEAIERIQIRLSQTPGQLSLVEVPDGGALSEAEPAGSLTFTSQS